MGAMKNIKASTKEKREIVQTLFARRREGFEKLKDGGFLVRDSATIRVYLEKPTPRKLYIQLEIHTPTGGLVETEITDIDEIIQFLS